MVSAFGSTDAPTSSGYDPVSTANTMASFVKTWGLDGIDVDYEVSYSSLSAYHVISDVDLSCRTSTQSMPRTERLSNGSSPSPKPCEQPSQPVNISSPTHRSLPGSARSTLRVHTARSILPLEASSIGTMSNSTTRTSIPLAAVSSLHRPTTSPILPSSRLHLRRASHWRKSLSANLELPAMLPTASYLRPLSLDASPPPRLRDGPLEPWFGR